MPWTLVRTIRLLARVVVGALLAVELVLGVGVLLHAMAANADAPFVDWTYGRQDRLLTPFDGMFDEVGIGDGEGVLDLSALFAMAAYGLLFVVPGLVLGWVKRTVGRREEDERRAAEERRQAAMFGRATVQQPQPAPPTPPGVVEWLRGRLGRRRAGETSGGGAGSSDDLDPDL